MGKALPLKMRGRKRTKPRMNGQPTIGGTARAESTLNVSSNGVWDSTIIAFGYQWQVASAPFTTWSNLLGATSSSLTLATSEIDKRARVVVSATNLDGTTSEPSQPSAIIQANPAQALSIQGTPVTAGTIGHNATFNVVALGGRPATSGAKYTFAIIGGAPAGSSVIPSDDSDEAVIRLGTAAGGTFGPLRVRVTDSIGNTAELGPFTFTVIAEGTYQTPLPGAGWSGLTVAGSNFGNAAGVGYGHRPTVRYDTPPFIEFDQPYVLWIYARMSGDKSVWDAASDKEDPTYGMDPTNGVRVGLDGTYTTIIKQYNQVDKAWGYPVRIDPALWPDGVPTLGDTGQRTMRIAARPRNGNEMILQGSGANSYSQAFRFSTNNGGSLVRAKRYFSVDGNSGNTGLTENSPKPNIEEALATIPSNQINGAILEGVKAGSYDFHAASARTATTRWLTIQGKASLPQDAIVLRNPTGGSSSVKVNLTRLKHLKNGTVLTGQAGYSYLWFDDCLCDIGSAYLRVNDNQPWVQSFKPTTSGYWAVFFTGGRVTNYPNAFRYAHIVNGTSAGTIASDIFTNVLFAINVIVDRITAGTIESSPGVKTKNGFHPDAAQFFYEINIAGGGWKFGSILINTIIVVCDGQGPFFKDCNYIDGIFIENANWNMTINTSRNDLSVFLNNQPNPTFTRTILRNSHFWNCVFYEGGGTRGNAGSAGWEDVVWKNVRVKGPAPGGGCVVFQPYTP